MARPTRRKPQRIEPKAPPGRRPWVLLGLAVLLAIAATVGGFMHYASSPFEYAGGPVRVSVDPGNGLKSVSRQLARKGVIAVPWAFTALGRARGLGESLQAGVYEVTPALTPNGLLDRMVRGEALHDEIKFIEGWTFRQMRAALDAHPGLRHDTRELQDREILQRIGAIENHPEGLFFPDTYRFSVGVSDLVVLRVAHARMRERLKTNWETRAPGLPLNSPYDLLTLASIVEKETGAPEDRTLIAAVFMNRLRIGMRLQTDPTVIYGMGARFDGNLRRRDLETDTPYNTYTRGGLPPTPIALPGEAALAAAANPASSRALYFVARGDGSSHFSQTLTEHNRAVNRFQLQRR
jgi:UPF0755 protein